MGFSDQQEAYPSVGRPICYTMQGGFGSFSWRYLIACKAFVLLLKQCQNSFVSCFVLESFRLIMRFASPAMEINQRLPFIDKCTNVILYVTGSGKSRQNS